MRDKDQQLDRQLEYNSSLSNAEGNFAVVERDLGAGEQMVLYYIRQNPKRLWSQSKVVMA